LGISGAAQKGAASFATGLANSTYGDQFNRLLNLSNMGSGAASALGGFATNTGANIANTQTGIGNAQAAGAVGVGNAASNAVGSIGNLYLTNALLGQMQNNNPGGATAGGTATQSNPLGLPF
jgi:hypothetical protein